MHIRITIPIDRITMNHSWLSKNRYALPLYCLIYILPEIACCMTLMTIWHWTPPGFAAVFTAIALCGLAKDGMEVYRNSEVHLDGGGEIQRCQRCFAECPYRWTNSKDSSWLSMAFLLLPSFTMSQEQTHHILRWALCAAAWHHTVLSSHAAGLWKCCSTRWSSY